jgi:predicted lipid carrier protein YhbT
MSAPPEDPDAFFAEYLKTRFDEAGGGFSDFSSIGSVLFRVVDAGEWSLKIRDGALEVIREMEDDVVLQITVPKDDFSVLVVEPANRLDAASGPLARQSAAIRRLLGNPETSRLVRRVPGSLLAVVRDGDRSHRVLVTAGRRAADFASADCTVEMSLEDWLLAQTGALNPSDLFMKGKLRIRGNVQIAMALAGAFS